LAPGTSRPETLPLLPHKRKQGAREVLAHLTGSD
jgi:hypothetical protein